jgi:hypothetical protein
MTFDDSPSNIADPEGGQTMEHNVGRGLILVRNPKEVER